MSHDDDRCCTRCGLTIEDCECDEDGTCLDCGEPVMRGESFCHACLMAELDELGGDDDLDTDPAEQGLFEREMADALGPAVPDDEDDAS